MQPARVLGVANPMQFPDDMDINDIKEFLRRKFTQQAVTGNKPADLAPIQPTIQASSPSLATRAAQGIGNALTSSGLISNNASAQEIGKNVTSIGEFLPVIGDATAGDEFGRALREGDGVGMALGALGAIPLVGDAAKKAGKKIKSLSEDEFKSEFINMKLYHGTNQDLKEFKLSEGGKVSGSQVGSISVASTQDKGVAQTYANEAAEKYGGKPSVIELVHRAERPAKIELNGDELNHEMLATVQQAWDDGKDALMLTNYNVGKGKKGTVILVKDPSQLRKKGAKFNPKNKFSPELLAGIGGMSVIYSLQGEKEEPYQ
jgi:hypothetical protein